eukprot:Seg1236.7 transcript_id=Seg1236.7/GoldUCD/mRNA.D3Y31 product="hypothetical protein" protein_id=Seg1236.7/GoldUCD/D3Y31
MAAFRKSCLQIIENEDQNSEEERQFCTQTVDENEGEDSHDRISIANETDEEAEEDDVDEADQVLGQELQAQGSTTLKRKKKAGRKSCWPEKAIDEVVDIICENEYYRKRLIFTNNKASKNLEIYSKIVNEARRVRLNERGTSSFEFTPVQTKTKFKSCVATCKKASMTRKCGSGIANFMDQKPAFQARSNSDSGETSDSRASADATPNSLPKDKMLFVPTLPKRVKKETSTSLLKEAVTAFNKFASKDP